MKIVILDAGHGGVNPITGQYMTAGKRSPIWKDGSVYYEGVGNREIAEIAAKMLRKAGVLVLFTVEPSDFRDVSLPERIHRSNNHFRAHPEAVQISIHSNAFTDSKANGSEVWTSVGQTKSDKLADVWMSEFSKEFPLIKLRTDKSDGDIDKEGKLALNSVKCASILIETMFHTNEAECRVLMSLAGKEKIAKVICNTILNYKA